MKKLFALLVVLLSAFVLGVGCSSPTQTSSGDNSTDTHDAANTTQNTASPTTQQYSIGDEVTILGDDGNAESTITINSVKISSERNKYYEFPLAQVVVVNYTYKNTNVPNGLFVSDMNIQVIDQNGELADGYPSETSKYPDTCPVGASCTAEQAYALMNESQTVTINYRTGLNSEKDVRFVNVPVLQ